MSIRVALDHQTQYTYDRLVFLSPQWIRLKPAAHARTWPETYVLTVEPANHVLHWQQDPFGNFVARVDFMGAVQKMTIRVQLTVNLEPVNPFDFFVDSSAETFPFAYEAQLEKDLAPYLNVVKPDPSLVQWVSRIDQTQQATIDFLVSINRQVTRQIAYITRLDAGVQTADETLGRGVGSCRDSAWLLVLILRQIGLAARFVSGYLIQVADPASPLSPETDSLALHAWTEVYLPGAGWIGLDTTSGMMTTERHIPLACTADPVSAAPVTGATSQSEVTLTYQSVLARLPWKASQRTTPGRTTK